jgi:hypothetical protein
MLPAIVPKGRLTVQTTQVQHLHLDLRDALIGSVTWAVPCDGASVSSIHDEDTPVGWLHQVNGIWNCLHYCMTSSIPPISGSYGAGVPVLVHTGLQSPLLTAPSC